VAALLPMVLPGTRREPIHGGSDAAVLAAYGPGKDHRYQSLRFGA